MSKKIIVSVTSYPRRISNVHKMVKSLYQQTVKPDKIILWLSLQEFPEKEKNLPKELLRLLGENGFEICWVEGNIRSHKKYYYALQLYRNDIVITVDDDIFYSATMIEELMNSYYRFPNAISARNVYRILKYENKIADYEIWENNCKEYNEKQQDLCAIGWGGVLYPPHIVSSRWFRILDIKKYSPDQDDLWLKFNEILDNIATVYVKKSKDDVLIENTQDCALYKTNIYENQNNICIEHLFKWSMQQDRTMIENWLSGLLESDKYYMQKKEKLSADLKKISQIYFKQKNYICGAGKYAKALIRMLEYCGVYKKITGLLVSDTYQNPKMFHGLSVMEVKDINFDKDTLIICGVSKKNRDELKPYFDSKQCQWLDLDTQDIFKCIQKIDLLENLQEI